MYIGKSPVGMTGTKIGTAKNIVKAMILCQKNRKSKGCNGFEWNGKTFTVYKYKKLTKPKINKVSYIAYGTTLKSSSKLVYKFLVKNCLELTNVCFKRLIPYFLNLYPLRLLLCYEVWLQTDWLRQWNHLQDFDQGHRQVC